MSGVTGVLLAAGGGARMGRPKALLLDGSGRPWLHRGVAALRDGGCDRVTVVLGAESERAAALLADQGVGQRVDVVVAADWQQGMGASLRAGLRAVTGTGADVAVVSLVDLPDVGAAVVRRVAAAAVRDASPLARAAYQGVPGHPVVLGREHWPGAIAAAVGDRGARDYLAGCAVRLVECGDLAAGLDADTPEDLARDAAQDVAQDLAQAGPVGTAPDGR